MKAYLSKGIVVFGIGLVVAGCSGIPYAVIDGSKVAGKDGSVHGVYIKQVDDRTYFTKEYSMNIEPGKRTIKLKTTKPRINSANSKDSRVIEIDAKPCKRYFVQAKHDKGKKFSSKYWEIELIKIEDIKSCKVPEGYRVPGENNESKEESRSPIRMIASIEES